MTPGRFWWILRKDFKRGFRASYYDYAVAGKIRQWENPNAGQAAQPVPIYTLCSKDTVYLCQWMLASWFHFTKRNWNVFVYEDGTLSGAQREILTSFLPSMRLISPRDLDDAMQAALGDKPACSDYRARHPLAKKIFDIPVLAGDSRFILIDTDVLFFREPSDLLRWADSGNGETWFNSDFAEPSPISLDILEKQIGVRPWGKVNSGLCLLPPKVVDLDFCEGCLKSTGLLSSNLWRVEQTLFALCAARSGRGGLLPATYEVSISRKRTPRSISRHYVGAVRDLFYAEGIADLRGEILNS